MTSDVETNIVAVERIKEYGETEQVCKERERERDIIAYLGSAHVWNHNLFCKCHITVMVATFLGVIYVNIYSRHYFDLAHQRYIEIITTSQNLLVENIVIKACSFFHLCIF
jgi:hypothetical protein